MNAAFYVADQLIARAERLHAFRTAANRAGDAVLENLLADYAAERAELMADPDSDWSRERIPEIDGIVATIKAAA